MPRWNGFAYQNATPRLSRPLSRTRSYVSVNRSEIRTRVRSDVRRFLIMFAYLLLIFTLFQLHEYVVLRQHELPYTRFGFGIIKALVLAKVMLIGDEMKLGRRLSKQPFIYSVIGRSALFTVLFVAFDFLEQIVRALFTGRDIGSSISDPGGSVAGSVIIALTMCVMLTPYFAFVELGRRFGVHRLSEVLLSTGGHGAPGEEPKVAA